MSKRAERLDTSKEAVKLANLLDNGTSEEVAARLRDDFEKMPFGEFKKLVRMAEFLDVKGTGTDLNVITKKDSILPDIELTEDIPLPAGLPRNWTPHQKTWLDGTVRVETEDGRGFVRKPDGKDGYTQHNWGPRPDDNFDVIQRPTK